eukprot:3012727-Rhodomonas_salina.1
MGHTVRVGCTKRTAWRRRIAGDAWEGSGGLCRRVAGDCVGRWRAGTSGSAYKHVDEGAGIRRSGIDLHVTARGPPR